MAVVQISRVQQRRGLQQDLPQLASAEFGWTLDQRRLFIGNGTISEGAPSEGVTEILTQYSDVLDIVKNYIFKGRAAGYTAQTGAAPSNPVKRYWQDKLDDVVSVKDFGATGDGVTNDVAAINRAIQQIYLHNRVQTVAAARRTIYFPAGVYVLSGDVIRMPPWLRIIGDGMGNTIIKQTDITQTCVIESCDSEFQTGEMLGTVANAALPTKINVESLTLHNDNERNVAVLESVDTATFRLVAFTSTVTADELGMYVEGNAAYGGIRFKSQRQVQPTRNINLELCQFSGLRYHLVSDESLFNVKINGCALRGGYRGIQLGKFLGEAAIGQVRITNTEFSNITAESIDCYAGCETVVSSGNIFNGHSTVENGPYIRFRSTSNYSIGDAFESDYQPVVSEAGNIMVNSTSGLTMGTLNVGVGRQTQLNRYSYTYMYVGVDLPENCIINYRLSCGMKTRFGTITAVVSDAATTQFTDNYHGDNVGCEFEIQGGTWLYLADQPTEELPDAITLSYSITQL